MINLLPKEKKNQPQARHNFNRIIVLTVIIIFVLGLCFFGGYLYYELTNNQAKLEQLNIEMKCYTTPNRKVKNIEVSLNQLQTKNDLKQAVYKNYLNPLTALTTLIQLKPNLIWFERIEFNSIDGGFTITGGAINYQALTGYIGQFEQDKAAFSQIKPEQAIVYDNAAGREYIQFKISGILAKRSEMSVQNN
jgi:hypothetical protein